MRFCLGNSAEPGEMPHAIFHLGLRCFKKYNVAGAILNEMYLPCTRRWQN